MKMIGAFVLFLCAITVSQTRLFVDASKPGVDISPTMYGVFFEDINFGADGGLYAEMVKNRSFEFDEPLLGWRIIKKNGATGSAVVRKTDHLRNPHVLSITIDNSGDGFGLLNEGFRGMGVHKASDYLFQFRAKHPNGKKLTARIKLVTPNGDVLAESIIKNISKDWDVYDGILTATATEAKAQLVLWFEGSGSLDVDMISLFPKATWKGRKNGLRHDLVQLLADMKPGFLRFPGGCIVEGYDLSQRYQWKHTIGDPADRIYNINRWNFEFKHRPTPDYFQSYGLGFYEYFLLAEDIGAEPMPIINCGMACQFNTAELVPMDQLDPYIQDALDLIEFANGPDNSRWGKIRADMGHPEPFNMKMLGVGNEQWGPQYVERYNVFASALKEKYPAIQLIAATGSDATIFPNGQQEIEYLWSHWRDLKPDFVDEHFYRKADWFLQNVDWYDDYDRSGPKLFVGEWAAQSEGVGNPDNKNTWKTALVEAAFMIGFERNSDLVRMSCYAPLFAHEEAWQWRPDLIWFDNLTSYGSANYYVQKLFNLNAGTHLLPVNINTDKKDLFASAVLDKNSGEIIFKIVNAGESPVEIDFEGLGLKSANSTINAILLTTASLDDVNSLQEPQKIYPKEFTINSAASEFTHRVSALSLTILRVQSR
jgi:alpha-N-arabinofuranosidase